MPHMTNGGYAAAQGRDPTFKLFEQNSACALAPAAFLPPVGAVSWARMTPLPTLGCAQFAEEKADCFDLLLKCSDVLMFLL